MPMTRRFLLSSLAAVAGAMATRGLPAASIAAPSPALTEREAFFAMEHEWAARGLLRACETKDFTPWVWGDGAESPCRWRLARAVAMIREVGNPSDLERTLQSEFSELWYELTRPGWFK